jgi:hypothetical protein
MPLPHAHQVLWFLGIFLGLWALSVILRSPRRKPGGSTAAAAPAPVPTPTRPRPTLVSAQHSRRLGLALLPVSLAIVIAGSALRRWVYYGDTLDDAWTFWDIAGLAGLVFAAILLTRALIGDRAKGRDRCPACWYDMSGSAAAGRLTCPECGHVSKTPADLRRARRSKPFIAFAAILLLISLWLPRLDDARKHGWKMLIPTAVMIAFMDHLPENWIVDNWQATDESVLSARLRASTTPKYLKSWAKRRVEARYEHPASFEQFTRASLLWYSALTTVPPVTERQAEILVQTAMAEDPGIAQSAYQGLFETSRQKRPLTAFLDTVAPRYADLIASRLRADTFEEFYRAASLAFYAKIPDNELIPSSTRWIHDPGITVNQRSQVMGLLSPFVTTDPSVERLILDLPSKVAPEHREQAWIAIASMASYAEITPAIHDALIDQLSGSISPKQRWHTFYPILEGPSADPSTAAGILAKARADPVYFRATFDAFDKYFFGDAGPVFDLHNQILTLALQSPDPALVAVAVQRAAIVRGSVARVDHVRAALRNLADHPDPAVAKTAREIIDWYEASAENPANAPR